MAAELPTLVSTCQWDSPTMPTRYTEAKPQEEVLWPGITGVSSGNDQFRLSRLADPSVTRTPPRDGGVSRLCKAFHIIFAVLHICTETQ